MNHEITNKFIIEQIEKRTDNIITQTQENYKNISNYIKKENQNIDNLNEKLNDYDNKIILHKKNLDKLSIEIRELENIDINQLVIKNKNSIQENDDLIKKNLKEILINKQNADKLKIIIDDLENKKKEKKENKNNKLYLNIEKNNSLLKNKQKFFEEKKIFFLNEIEELNKSKSELISHLEKKENLYQEEKDNRQKNRKNNTNNILELKKYIKNIENEIKALEVELEEKENEKKKFIKNQKLEKENKYLEVNKKLKEIKSDSENKFNLEILQEIDNLNSIIENFEIQYERQLKQLIFEIDKLRKNIRLLEFKKKIQKKNIEDNNCNNLISKKIINEFKKDINILNEKIKINEIELNNINVIEDNMINSIRLENNTLLNKIQKNNEEIDNKFKNMGYTTDLLNINNENDQLEDEIKYLKNINMNIINNHNIYLKSLKESKRNNKYNQEKNKIKLQIYEDNYERLKHKINLKEKSNEKYIKELEYDNNELIINQLLDLYNLKKLNEML